MGIFNFFKKNKELLVEALPSYKNKGKEGHTETFLKNTAGEGYNDLSFISGYGKSSVHSFNNFYSNYINIEFNNKLQRINYYRIMADMPEIAAVLEDIVTESTISDEEGNVVSLEIVDEELKTNQNIVKNLEDEFRELFFKNLDINTLLGKILYTYYVDGEVFCERINNKGKPSNGLLKLNILPTETMDVFYNKETQKIEAYFQYLENEPKKPATIEEALEDNKIIVFYPAQISYVNYSRTGRATIGYLEKAKQPFNQLKLLETSVIIYRLVRSPERLVFRIDTGSMPRDKAMKFVEKIKQRLSQKISYDTTTGNLDNQPDVISMLDNYFLPQCLRLDTKISCLDGTEKTLSQMIDDFNNGIKNEVLSVDQQTGKIIHGEVEWAGITRKNAELIRVYLDNNEFIDVTPDHKFVMRDGSEKEAQYLKENDSLMPYYTRNKKIGLKDYKQVFDVNNNSWKFIHRIVKPVQKGNVVHHKDFNRFNNMKSNLLEMDSIEHFKYHSKISKENLKKQWQNKEFRDKMIQIAKENVKKRWSDPSKRKKQSIRMKKYWNDNYQTFYNNVSLPKTEQHKKSLSKSIKEKWNDPAYRKKCSISSAKRWNDSDFKNKMSNIQKCIINHNVIKRFEELYKEYKPSMYEFINILSNDSKFMNEWSLLNKDKKNVRKDKLGKQSFYNILKYMNYDNFTKFKQDMVINHKVVKVEWLNFKEDTGCLTIKDPGNNHNFALTVGIFVKNSADGRGSTIDSVGGDSAGFQNIDDIWYFSRKLYAALRYPMSRIANMQEGRTADTLFMNGSSTEINRDEIRWAKFLEGNQNKFANELKDIFLLHLEFKGLKKEYELDSYKIKVALTPPNNYKDQMNQVRLEMQMNNYQNFANNQEFSKSFLMMKFLGYTEEDLKNNSEGFDLDKKYLPQDDSGY